MFPRFSESRRKGAIFAAGMLGLCLAAGGVAEASCGLEGCPVSGPRSSVQKTDFLVFSEAVRVTGFDIEGISGSYVQSNLRSEYRGLDPWILGAVLPMTYLSMDASSHFGVGNPVIFAQYTFASTQKLNAGAGLQLELPFGHHDHGMAAEHLEFFPYASLTRVFQSGYLFGTGGLRFAAGDHAAGGGHGHKADEDDGHGDFPLLVNPHAETELMYQFGLGRPFGGLRGELFVMGQKVLRGGEEGVDSYLTGGAQASGKLGSRLELSLYGELPLSSPGRIEWRAGFGLSFGL